MNKKIKAFISHKKFIVCAGLVLFFGAAAAWAFFYKSNEHSFMKLALEDRPSHALDIDKIMASYPEIAKCLSDPGEKLLQLCVDDELKNLTLEEGPRTALDVIESYSQKYPVLMNWAHPFAHTIGDYAVKYYENNGLSLESQIGRGIVECDGYGSFGCYHGIIESTTTKIPAEKRGETIRKACFDDPAIASKPYFVQQCAHWFGHSITVFTDMPLLDVLKACEDISPNWGHGGVQLCLSGVFHSGLAPGEIGSDEVFVRNILKVRKDGDPYYPCLEIPEKFRGHCYSHAYGRANSLDLSVQLETCNNIPESDPTKKRIYVSGCYDSVGNNVIELSAFSPAEIVKMCREHAAPEFRMFCYGGAARYWVLRNPMLDNVGPLEMCSLAEAEAKPFCYARAGFGNFENFASRDILNEFCSRAESDYQSYCKARTAPWDFAGDYVRQGN